MTGVDLESFVLRFEDFLQRLVPVGRILVPSDVVHPLMLPFEVMRSYSAPVLSVDIADLLRDVLRGNGNGGVRVDLYLLFGYGFWVRGFPLFCTAFVFL